MKVPPSQKIARRRSGSGDGTEGGSGDAVQARWTSTSSGGSNSRSRRAEPGAPGAVRERHAHAPNAAGRLLGHPRRAHGGVAGAHDAVGLEPHRPGGRRGGQQLARDARVRVRPEPHRRGAAAGQSQQHDSVARLHAPSSSRQVQGGRSAVGSAPFRARPRGRTPIYANAMLTKRHLRWRYVALMLGPAGLAACAHAPTSRRRSICYRTLADVSCYVEPDKGRDEQLVGVYLRDPAPRRWRMTRSRFAGLRHARGARRLAGWLAVRIGRPGRSRADAGGADRGPVSLTVRLVAPNWPGADTGADVALTT